MLNCCFCFWPQELPDESALHQLLSQDVDNALWTLTEKERGVLRMRYGLDDGEEKTLEDIGVCFNVRTLLCIQLHCSPRCAAGLFCRVETAHQCVVPCAGHARAHSTD